jgi:putative ABC transport system ATP-binding protein
VIITHDEALAAHCDRVVTLADGRIVSDSGE